MSAPFSSDPRDTVREYAPDAVRAAAFAFGAEHGTAKVGWHVRPDGAFDVHAHKRGGSVVSVVIDREGERC